MAGMNQDQILIIFSLSLSGQHLTVLLISGSRSWVQSSSIHSKQCLLRPAILNPAGPGRKPHGLCPGGRVPPPQLLTEGIEPRRSVPHV